MRSGAMSGLMGSRNFQYGVCIVNDKMIFVLAFTASDFGRFKRHISFQNPSASAGGFIVCEILYFAYYKL